MAGRGTVKVFCTMMIVASLVAIVFGVYSKIDSDRFLSVCQETQAEVLRAVSKNPEDGGSFSIIRYSIDEKTYEESVDGLHEVGTKIAVLYDPNNPRDVRLPSEPEMSYLFAMVFGVGNLIFWLVMVGFQVRRTREKGDSIELLLTAEALGSHDTLDPMS